MPYHIIMKQHNNNQSGHNSPQPPTTKNIIGGVIFLILVVLSSTTGLGAQSEDQQAGNRIGGTLNGEQSQWQVLNKPPFASAVFSTILPGVHNVRITGYADGRGAREGSITLEFNLRDGEVLDPKLLYFPFSPLHPRFSYASDHGEGKIIIEQFEDQGLSARVKGSFQGTLFYHQSRNTRPISHRTQDLALEFEVIAERH